MNTQQEQGQCKKETNQPAQLNKEVKENHDQQFSQLISS